MVGGYWMDVLEMRVEMCDGIEMGYTGCTGNGGNDGRMRMLKYFVDKYPIEICRLVD